MSTLLDLRSDRFDQLLGSRRGATHYRDLLAALTHGHRGQDALSELDRLTEEGSDFEHGSANVLLDAFTKYLLAERRAAWTEQLPVMLKAFGMPADADTVNETWQQTADWMAHSLSSDPFDGSPLDWYLGFTDGQLLAGIGFVCAPAYHADPRRIHAVLGDRRYSALSNHALQKSINLQSLLDELDETQWWSVWGNAMHHYATDDIRPHNTTTAKMRNHLAFALRAGIIDGEFS